MLKSLRVFVGVFVALVAIGLSGSVSHAIPDGEWSPYEHVPGLIGANVGQSATFTSVSCASVGNCSAGGSYVDVGGDRQAFVVSQVDGVWQTIEDVPGLVAANAGGNAEIKTLSCAAVGNCSAGGEYTEAGATNSEAFVVSQVDGVWQTFEEVPGLAAAATGPFALVNSISCATAGNCSAGGRYSVGSIYDQQAFVVSQVDGVWQTFEDVPGLVAANTAHEAQLRSISCGSAGNCTAGGTYQFGDYPQAFVVSQIDGVWQQFDDVGALVAIPSVIRVRDISVSCASAGNCSAVGRLDNTSYGPLFVMSQVNGVWGSIEYLQGLEAINTGSGAEFGGISCASAGNCTVAGGYGDDVGYQVFVVSQVNGVWGTVENVPGLNAANAGGDGAVRSVSCAAPGECSIGGIYADANYVGRGFLASQIDGVWQTYVDIPGFESLSDFGYSDVLSVSCAAPGNCLAVGNYAATGVGGQVFVTSIETSLTPPTSSTTPSTTSSIPLSTVAPPPSSGAISTFEDIPGLVAANTGEVASVVSMSCSSTGNCSAGGYYHIGRSQEAFVVSQVNGVWGSFEDVPGLVAANNGGAAVIGTVSCSSAGNCSAGGNYRDNSDVQAFVVSQVDGVWGSFENVPGLVAANTDGSAFVKKISCASDGNCSGVGFYNYGGTQQAFVVSQVNGVWQTFENVPGLVAANTAGYASMSSISCTSPGNCSAGGFYTTSNDVQAFVVSQVNGVWGIFVDVPGLVAENIGTATTNSVSCTSTGSCVAVGSYTDLAGTQAFVVSQVDGVWQMFEDVPSLVVANVGGYSTLNTVSCTSVGDCSAGGFYTTLNGVQAFVVSQVDGAWGSFEDVPGLIAANSGGFAFIASLSCASAGNCAAGGSYSNGSGSQVYLVLQVDGVWGTYEVIPGLAAANTGGLAVLNSVSCGAVGQCSVGGDYRAGFSRQAFVASISVPSTESTTTTGAPTTTANVSPSSAVVQNLPATGRGSSSSLLMSLMLILSGVLIVSGLRRRIS
jgi:LPXTG-motif cell wall-anchored protein